MTEQIPERLIPPDPLSPPTVVIEARKGLIDLDLRSLWQYRELLYFLVWRDIRVRYKQTVIGIGWAVLQPVVTMALFAVVFGRFLNVPTDDLPYPIFAFTALLPWNYFSQALDRSSNSLVANANLISKVYFPRLIIPLASVATPAIDFGLAFVVLLVMMALYRVTPTWGLVLLPVFLLLAVLTALAVSLWLSALNVKYRDVRYAIPFLVQVWMYASPIAYPVSIVPERWRVLYSLNPMAGVIEGFRWALLGKESPDALVMAISAGVVLVLLAGGLAYFKQMERTFADVV